LLSLLHTKETKANHIDKMAIDNESTGNKNTGKEDTGNANPGEAFVIPHPYHALWTRRALLITPYIELLLIFLFFFCQTLADRIRVTILVLAILPLTHHYIKPVLEPMLPAQRRREFPDLVPARMLSSYPGEDYESEYKEVVKVEGYVSRPSRRVVQMTRGGWFAVHE
jgi:hypothetical protein